MTLYLREDRKCLKAAVPPRASRTLSSKELEEVFPLLAVRTGTTAVPSKTTTTLPTERLQIKLETTLSRTFTLTTISQWPAGICRTMGLRTCTTEAGVLRIMEEGSWDRDSIRAI
jgi:hypothetical protein